MVVSLRQINSEDAWTYLTGIYSLRKLSQMGIYRKKGTYASSRAVDYVYAKVCSADRNLVNKNNAQYLLDICLSNLYQSDDIKEFAEYILSSYKFKQDYLDEKFKNIIQNQYGYSIADILWDNVTDEIKDKILDKAKPYGYGTSYSDESILFYFYKKGFITFDERKGEKYDNRNLSYFITSISLEMLKKIKFKITDKLIENFAANTKSHKNREYKIAYLFTIPEFRDKVVDNPQWMFYRKAPSYKGGSPGDAFIDCWPREYQQKYIDQLKEELRLKKLAEKNNNGV